MSASPPHTSLRYVAEDTSAVMRAFTTCGGHPGRVSTMLPTEQSQAGAKRVTGVSQRKVVHFVLCKAHAMPPRYALSEFFTALSALWR